MNQSLNVKALSLAMGIWWGVGMFIVAVVSMLTGGMGGAFIEMVSSAYLGYAATWPGAFIGLIWGFVDGLICGAILGWLYNRLNK